MKKVNRSFKENAIKTCIIVTALILVLLTDISFAAGLGVTPGRTTFEFSSSMEKTVEVKVLNNEKKDVQVAIFTRGTLGRDIQLSADSLKFSKDEGEKAFQYSFKLPERLEPGLQETEIVIREIKGGSTDEETTVSALVAVVSQLHINVPYPGKYMKAELFVKEAKENENVEFFIPVKSMGTENIRQAKPTVIIYGPDGAEFGRIEGNAISLETGQKHEFKLEWNADVSPGIYKAAAVVEYDGKRVAVEKMFLVGDFFLKPLDISVNNFQLGQVAKFNILVENVGNSLIEDAYAKMQLTEETGRMVLDTTSLKTGLISSERKELAAYWDTADIRLGTYEGTLTLGYADKLSEKRIRTIVEQDSIRTEIIGITALAIDSGKGEGLKIKWWYIAIALIVMANAVWLVYYRKKQEAKRNNEQSMQNNRPPTGPAGPPSS